MITITDVSASAKKYADVYESWLRPVCRKAGIPHTALCILMFFSGNPESNTAQQLCDKRGFKRAIVSMHIEGLVQKGFLKRIAVEGDRRKWGLVCTDKARPIIKEARLLHAKFSEAITFGFEREDLERIEEYFNIFRGNLELISKKSNS